MLEPTDGVIAVWIGDFPTQKEFDAYVEEYEGKASKKHPLSQFAREAGDEWYDHDFFTAWRYSKAKDVASLLTGAPYVESYGDAVVELAKKAGITRGNTVILLQDEQLKPANKWPAQSRLKYVGAVPYKIPGPPTPELRKTDHRSAVMYIAVTDDGRKAVTSDYHGELRLWDLAKGKLLGSAPGKEREYGDAFTAFEFALGGKAVVLGKDQAAIRKLTAKGFGPLQKLPMKAYRYPACSIGISPSGKLAAVGGLGELLVFDLAKNELKSRVALPKRTASNPVFRNEEQVVALTDSDDVTSSDKRVAAWTTAQGEPLFDFAGTTKSGSGLQLVGDMLAVWSNRFQVELLDLSAGKSRAMIYGKTGDMPVAAAIVSPNQKLLAMFDTKGSVHLLDLPSGKPRKTIKAHAGGTSSIAFTPDSKLLLTCGREANVRLWNLATGKQVAEFADVPASRKMPESYQSDGYTLKSAAAARDGKTFVVGEDSGRVHILKLQGKKLVPA